MDSYIIKLNYNFSYPVATLTTQKNLVNQRINYSFMRGINSPTSEPEFQEAERVAHQFKGRWFDPWLFQSVCQSVLEQDTEPQIAPDAESSVHECVCGLVNVACVVKCFE